VIHRVTSAVLLLGGAVLLATWVSAPAAPIPQAGAVVDATSVVRSAAGLAPVEFDRLRARLAAVPGYQTPVRDPFRFGASPSRPQRQSSADLPVVRPASILPRLVAILSDGVGAGVTRRVVVSMGTGIQVASVGDRLGAYVVRAIGTDDAELVDPATGAAFRISIH
jgi:hypothetical protein